MFSDNRFKRTFLSESSGKFSAEQIKMTLGSGFLHALGLEQPAKLADLFGDSGDALRYGFKLESKLAALTAKGFHLEVRIHKFGVQTLAFAIHAGTAFLGLSELVAKPRHRRDCIEDGDARFLLLVFEFCQRG